MIQTRLQVFISYLVLFIAVLMISFATYNIGSARTERHIRIDAVKNGYAKWVVDEEGKVKFEWISRC